MNHPLLILVPWGVFALAAGLKFWRLLGFFRQPRRPIPAGTEQVRQSLERIWAKAQLPS